MVCSIQTVARRGLPDVDLIVIDEAHGVAGSQDYRKVLFANNLLPVIGLTATPFACGLAKHYDELHGPLFETMVVAASIRDLINQGYLVDCDIYAPADPDLSGVGISRNAYGEADYNERQLARAVDKPKLVGEIVGHWMRLSQNRPTVVFATSIAHSKHITAEFNGAGIPAEHIDAYTDDEERTAILDRVKSGVTRIISNVSVLAEGWDFPACGVMILARPTWSLTRYIQMVGRILRPHDGKDRAIVLDHSGSAANLPWPTDDLPLELDDGTPNKAGKRKKEPPKPSKCPSCTYIKPPKVHACPACGFAPERKTDVEVQDGALVRLEHKRKASRFEKQAAYSQLISIADERGYSYGWVSHKYHDMFGVWPCGLDNRPEPATPELRSWVKSQAIRYAKGQEGRHAA
jgi:superfamily II DNA or RNA helicase